jgi:transposase
VVHVTPAVIRRDRDRGQSLRQIAKSFRISRATVSRVLKQSEDATAASM